MWSCLLTLARSFDSLWYSKSECVELPAYFGDFGAIIQLVGSWVTTSTSM